MNLVASPTVELLRELLADGKTVQFVVTGRSMRPFLRGGETVIVRRVAVAQVRPGDLLLCRQNVSGTERWLLHRVVAIYRHPGGPTLIQTHGDALLAPDTPVGEDQVLGRVCAVQRGPAPGRAVNLEAPGERLRAVGIALWLKGRWWIRATCHGLIGCLRKGLSKSPGNKTRQKRIPLPPTPTR
ncbi:MAG: hypothetical protein N2439_11145 [Anaerolineae bacterium]|nr:hypothetical protein [Anaerolineae bacterium]